MRWRAAIAAPKPFRRRIPWNLHSKKAWRFLRQIPDFGNPLPQLILTGGDPLARPDLYELIDEARQLGIGVSITPARLSALTREVLVRLKEHGVEGLGLSLDGSTAEAARFDPRRARARSTERMQAMRWAQELEMPLQVNTLVAAETADDVPAIYELLKPLGVARWSLFFLISVGRGKVLQPLTPEQGEKLMGWIFETSRASRRSPSRLPKHLPIAASRSSRCARKDLTGDRSSAARRSAASAFATATASCSCRTPATSVRRDFFR